MRARRDRGRRQRPFVALSLARSVVAAEADGQAAVGLSHFIDYLDALEAGRIDGKAEPELTQPAPAVILSDAKGGAAHPGFDLAFESLVDAAQHLRHRAVHAEERLHLRLAQLFRRPAGRARACRARRHQRTGAGRRLRLDEAGLLHQSDGLWRTRGRWPAAADRPVVERDRLRQHPRRGRRPASRFPTAGRSMPMASRRPTPSPR